MTLNKFLTAIKGGPGSGNWGHSGRPGMRGGSAPKGGGWHGGTGVGDIAYFESGKGDRFYIKIAGAPSKKGTIPVMHYDAKTGDFTAEGFIRTTTSLKVPTDAEISKYVGSSKPNKPASKGGDVTVGGSGKPELPSKQDVNALGSKLNGLKRGRVVGGQIDRDPDISKILSDGQQFDAKSAKFNAMDDGNCHWNVSKLYKEGKVDAIVIGYTNNGDAWYQHTWGLKDGNVVETTASNKGNPHYYGLPLTGKDANAFADWTSKNPPGGGVVRRVK